MNEQSGTRCPHCNAALETPSTQGDFWVRCGGCGRRVMPRSWRNIVNDPEPSALFEPVAREKVSHRPSQPGSIGVNPLRLPARGDRLARNQLLFLCLLSILATSTGCLIFSVWYSVSDLVICGFLGFLLAVFILFVPGLMVSIGTGAITLFSFGYVLGFVGNEIMRASYYFLFGFVLATVLQAARYALDSQRRAQGRLTDPAELSQE